MSSQTDSHRPSLSRRNSESAFLNFVTNVAQDPQSSQAATTSGPAPSSSSSRKANAAAAASQQAAPMAPMTLPALNPLAGMPSGAGMSLPALAAVATARGASAPFYPAMSAPAAPNGMTPYMMRPTSFSVPQPVPATYVSKMSLPNIKPNPVDYNANQNNDAASRIKQLKRYRESHNEVERRRRENINQVIGELATMVPDCYPGQSKGSILRKTADYIRSIQRQNGLAVKETKTEGAIDFCPRCSCASAEDRGGNSSSASESASSSSDSKVHSPSASSSANQNGHSSDDTPSANSGESDTDEETPAASASTSHGDSADATSVTTDESAAKRIKIEGDSCPIDAKPSNFEWRRVQSWQQSRRPDDLEKALPMPPASYNFA